MKKGSTQHHLSMYNACLQSESKKRAVFKNVKNGAGFTLVEILLVISLIGILAVGSIAAFNPLTQIKKGRDTKRKTDLSQLQSALELYRADKNAYPASLPACKASLVDSGTTYIKSTPCDPTTATAYTYTVSASGYSIIACLERADDPQEDNPTVEPCAAAGKASYTVTNP